MRIIEQSCQWEQRPPTDTLEILERAGRTCYKTDCKGAPDEFVRKILGRQHESVIEHVSASMRFVTDRGVTHEMVRHRLASYSQESTRYCNYTKDKFGKEITVILPVEFRSFYLYENETGASVLLNSDLAGPERGMYRWWLDAMQEAEINYSAMIQHGATAQLARSVLPNSLKTEIVMSCNLREWRHFFKMRTAQGAHPQMRDLAIKALWMFQEAVPVLFEEYLCDTPVSTTTVSKTQPA